MTAVSQPAARRGSTVFLPAPERPLPPEAAWSCWLSLRASSSFSNSDRSTLTVSPYSTGSVEDVAPLADLIVAADADADPQPAATTIPAESTTAQIRLRDITPSS